MGWAQEARATAQGIQSSFNVWGQGQWMNNFASGGISSYMFPTDDIRIRRGLFGSKVRPGSRAYDRNLQAIINARGGGSEMGEKALGLQKQYGGFANRIGVRGLGGRLAKGARGIAGGSILAGGFMAYTAYSTKGTAYDKTKATLGVAGSFAAWGPGMHAGMAIGGAIGALVPIPGAGIVGALAGAAVGGLAASAAGQAITEATIGSLNSIAERGKRRRVSNWVGDTSTFHTQKAATMRQASLQMMNNGMMTARNALGNEGIMFHQ